MADLKRMSLILLTSCAAVALAGCDGSSSVASPGEGTVVIPGTPTPTPTPQPTPTPTPGTPAADCPTGTSNVGVIGNYRSCRLPSQITSALSLPKVAGVAYEMNGRVDVGVDIGGAGNAPGGVSATLTIAPGAIVSRHSEIGIGSVLCDHVIVEPASRIGRHFHGNIYSYVAHECVIGDFVTFAPRVSCNGNVHIRDHVTVGTGASFRQGTPDRPLVIGERAVIQMGAVITRDVPADAVIKANTRH